MTDALVDRLLEAAALKDVDRAGWVRAGVAAPESVAAHTWGVAWLVLALLPDDLDRGRALTYAILHDLPEVRIGDLTPHDGVSKADKARREGAAMDDLAAPWPHLAAAWHAYEAQADPEARFVRQLDRIDMAVQAVVYGPRTATPLVEFLDSAATVVEHPRLVPILEALRARVVTAGG